MRSSTALMAAALLLLVSLAAAAERRSQQEMRRAFVEWKAKYGKTYSSIGEEERRYAVFKGHLRFIDQHNAAADAGVHSYRLRLYGFDDLTDEELRARSTGCLLWDKPERREKEGPVAEPKKRFSC